MATATDFPDRVYVTLATETEGVESLGVAFDPADCDGEIGVYELKSVGRNESLFVEGPPIEQQRPNHLKSTHFQG